MSTESRLESLRKRLTPEMQEAVREAVQRGRLPPSALKSLPDDLKTSLEQGRLLESMATTGSSELGNLEAIVKLVGRPPMLIRNDEVEMVPLPELPGADAAIQGVQGWIQSVGRIEFRNHEMAWGGTGWVVEVTDEGALVVTNRHVAQLVARRKADGTAVFLRSPAGPRFGAAIDFKEESGSIVGDRSKTAELTQIKFLAEDTAADVALLLIEAADFAFPTPFRLIDDAEDVRQGELVALIGYPAYDSRNDADAQAKYFKDLYEVKRFAPGKILQEARGGVLTYDCTSLGGNSGSPVIRLSDGKVVGLHFSGLYGKYNAAVSARTISALLRGERPVSVMLREGRQEAKDGTHAASHFTDRKGFATRFLGVQTPWPKLTEQLAEDLAVPSDNPKEPKELRYTHFGVKYSATHRIPLITAVNMDGEASVRIKRADDKWFADERIPKEIQLESPNFADAEIDRGHMVRREDPNWGDDAQQANDDTFHYVNAAAQHSRLNQGKQLWQGLENYILDSARTDGFKACVFTGPILRDVDSDEEEVKIDGAIVPQEFWKMVVTLDATDKHLRATAYVLSQGQLVRKLLEKRSKKEALEGATLGDYRSFQVSVKDLADATGYNFDVYVKADPLFHATEGKEAIDRGDPVALPLYELADMVL